MEHAFSGFQSATDTPKSFERSNFEVWTKFADAETNTREGFDGTITALSSAFDGIINLNTSKEECFRRAHGRKIDPTSGTVYHPEDNPPPENDAKLLERLTPYYGNFTSEEEMIEQLDLNHIQYSDNEQVLSSFLQEFGSFDAERKEGISTYCEITQNEKVEKKDIGDKIKAKMEEILRFKQIAQDRAYAEIKVKIQ